MKEEERIEGAQWLQEFFKIRDQLGPLITKVSKVQDGSYSDRFAAFSEALERMPVLLKAMKAAHKWSPKFGQVVKSGFCS